MGPLQVAVFLVVSLGSQSVLLAPSKNDNKGHPEREGRQTFILPYSQVRPVFWYQQPAINSIVLELPNPDCFNETSSLSSRFGAPEEPSRCVWAIVSCCSPGSTSIRYRCFELLGCYGAFWDLNPCKPEVTMAAANVALKYYASNQRSNDYDSGEPA